MKKAEITVVVGALECTLDESSPKGNEHCWAPLHQAGSCMTSYGILATPLNNAVRQELVIPTMELWKIVYINGLHS